MKAHLRIFLLIALITVLFYWRFLLSHQFSLLLGFEGANQAYAWLNFWVTTVRQGIWPLWDPFTFSGHPFAGEMQTSAFYPFNLLLALAPLHKGTFSPQLYHNFYALSHVFCAFFLYLLARELGLSSFAGLISGICFSLGGYVVRMGGWPHQLGSALWLPLIFLCLIRALGASRMQSAVAYSVFSGLGLALSILSGGLHVAMMQGLAALFLVVFYTAERARKLPYRPAVWMRAALVLAIFAVIALAGGAVQLLPAAEYSRQAFRFVINAKLPATTKIPYANLSDGLWPNSILGFLVAGMAGNPGSGEYINPYLGVFPLLMAIIAVWKNRAVFWVRFLAGLTLAVFLYSLGPLSLLHGVFYALAPFLWLAREPDRFLYLADFGVAILAGFGIDAILRAPVTSWNPLNQVLRWLLAACAVVMGYQAFLGRGDFSPWISFSILMIFLSYGLFRYVTAGHHTVWARFLIAALILFDLYAFDWTVANISQESAKHANALDNLLGLRGAADFLKAQGGGLFRTEVFLEPNPNVGDLFGIQTTLGYGATLVQNYDRFRDRSDLLNVRYSIRPPSATDPSPVYQDPACKIYEKSNYYPRAWLVHQTSVEPDTDRMLQLMNDSSMDLHRTALVDAPLTVSLQAAPDGWLDKAEFVHYGANLLELDVETRSSGLLVLSEVFYPGWKATVNGAATPVWRVDGMLRGLVVPAGKTRVAVYYAPASFFLGLTFSVLAFLTGAIVCAIAWIRTRTRAKEARPATVHS